MSTKAFSAENIKKDFVNIFSYENSKHTKSWLAIVLSWRKQSSGSPWGVVAYVLDCNIVVSEFEPQSLSYVRFRINTLEKDMDVSLFPNYGLYSFSYVLLQGWLWHWIAHESWDAIKQT